MKWSCPRQLSSPTLACQLFFFNVINPVFEFFQGVLCCFLCAFREIEGKEYIGEVKEKEKAKKQYEKAISSGQTAGLVQ